MTLELALEFTTITGSQFVLSDDSTITEEALITLPGKIPVVEGTTMTGT